MDIYADLPSANTSSNSSGSAGSSSTPSASSAVSKGSWAHSKFQGMIAKRRTVTAVGACSLLDWTCVPAYRAHAHER